MYWFELATFHGISWFYAAGSCGFLGLVSPGHEKKHNKWRMLIWLELPGLNQSTPRTLQSAAGTAARVHQKTHEYAIKKSLKTHGFLMVLSLFNGSTLGRLSTNRNTNRAVSASHPRPHFWQHQRCLPEAFGYAEWGWLGGYKWNSNLTSFPNSKECHVPGYKVEYVSHYMGVYISWLHDCWRSTSSPRGGPIMP